MKSNNRDMHSAVMDGDEGGGRDTFVELGVLVVEGRVPGPGPRGYAEGPHCVRTAPASTAGLQRHDCDTGFACVRSGQLRQHMSLLWENRVPVCVEVLLCPACPCGRAKAQCPDIVRLPSPADMLLEQWTISCSAKKSGDTSSATPSMGARGLVQAVRSQLHFSQLSAWWSSSRGALPANVTYRVTVPGEAFASQFRHPAPVTHTFPSAIVAGGASIRVSVRTAPRMESVPALLCTVHHESTAPATAAAPDEVPTHSDKLLGACLLDPPQSLEHRRFASPPRGASPVVDAPRSLRRESSPPSPPLSLQHRRLGREGLARRRDSSWKAASVLMVDDRMMNPCNRAGKHDCRCDEDGDLAPSEGKCAGKGFTTAKERYRPAKDTAGSSKECFAAAECFASATDGFGSPRRCGSPSLGAAEGFAVPKDGFKEGYSLPKPCYASTATTKECCKEAYSSGKEGYTEGREGYSEGKEKQRKRIKKEAEGCASDGKTKLNLELSPQEFEEVLSVLRDRNPSQPHHGTKSLSRSPDDQTCSRLAACKVQCFPVRAPTPPSDASAKADPFLDAILRTSGRAAPDLASDLAAKISKLSVEPGLHSGTKRKRFQPKSSYDDATAIGTASRRKHRHEPACSSPTNIDERTLSSAPRQQKANKAIGDLVLSEKVPCDYGATVSIRGESVIGGGEDAVGDIVGADAIEAAAEKVGGKAEDENRAVPSASDKEKFRRSLDFAASMVFHSRTGLPLTSSPAPVRRNATCFDYDSSITSVSAIRSALFETSAEETLSSDEAESEGRSPCSPRVPFTAVRCSWSRCTHLASSLLGTFEESVLNGRLEPVSTVQGFTANLGASGSFCPRHVALPVTVFFYTLGDNDKVSTPYLAHINLGKKGYNVPRCGTIQVTLFNPLGTVVKMFVVMYDLTDMPANSQTFLRQRTLYMPANAATSRQPGDFQKWLRYLVHLRFSSSKSGRVYLHSDIRMIVFRKSDLDTATAHGVDMSYELRSFTQGPTNPKFSSRN